MNETTNEQVTISAAYFAELWRRANETDKICRECTNEHTAEEFATIKRERDELKAKLNCAESENYKCRAMPTEYKRCRKSLTAAERCIEDVYDVLKKSVITDCGDGLQVYDIIRDYRKKKEAK